MFALLLLVLKPPPTIFSPARQGADETTLVPVPIVETTGPSLSTICGVLSGFYLELDSMIQAKEDIFNLEGQYLSSSLMKH